MLPTWPYYSQKEIDIVSKVLSSGKVNYWTGDITSDFENDFSKLCNCKYSVAVSNGTLALSLAYQALNIKAGDEIITTPRTFIATSSSAVRLGAIPIFSDVDLNSGNITAENIEPLITKKTKAISVVHLAGWPADMESIKNLAKSKNIYLIEDCSQAHGAGIYNNEEFNPVGSFGDISTWSFCQDKIISTGGEGGMISTNSKEIWEKVWSLKDHGKTIEKVKNTNHAVGYRWLHDNFGTNCRLTEMQSALGKYQLSKLTNWIDIRNRNAMAFSESFKNINCVRLALPNSNLKHAWYKFNFYIKTNNLKTDWTRDRLLNEINQYGYPATQGSCSEIYLEKCFKDAKLSPANRLTNAKELGETCIQLLLHPTIDENAIYKYADSVKRILESASK